MTASFTAGNRQREDAAKKQRAVMEQRLASVRSRLDQAYVDKLNGTIAEAFWQRKSAEWHEEERPILSTLPSVNTQPAERILDTARILELANEAYSLILGKVRPKEPNCCESCFRTACWTPQMFILLIESRLILSSHVRIRRNGGP